MSKKHTTQEFIAASQYIRNILTIEAIADEWHKSGLGRPATENTISRWMNLGPKTKNPRFEPFIIRLAEEYKNKEADTILAAIRSRKGEREFRIGYLGFLAEEDMIDSRRDRATAASLAAFFKYDTQLSPAQEELVDKLYGKVSKRYEPVYRMVLERK
jgi:hypothetical protein